MQIRQLEYFLSLCETLNFTRTAETFFVSQTAVTQQIRALETELGTPLFARTKRHVELTPAGAILREDATLILRHLCDAETRIRTLTEHTQGVLRIGFLPMYEYEGLIDVLRAFHERCPDVSLSLTRGSAQTLLKQIRQGNLDLIFTHLHLWGAPPEFETRVVKHYPLMALLPKGHSLAALPAIRPEDLQNCPMVEMRLSEEEKNASSPYARFFREAGFLPRPAFVAEDIETVICAVSAGYGYALLPSFITDRVFPDSPTVVRPIIGHEQEVTVAAVWRKDAANPMPARFLDLCAVERNR